MKYYWMPLNGTDMGDFEFGFQIVLGHAANSYDDIYEFALWCANNFKHNYILLGKQHEILSGGCSDNVKHPWMPHDFDPTIEFELRCCPKDALLVKLTWDEWKNDF